LAEKFSLNLAISFATFECVHPASTRSSRAACD
jgi:hypothetical protein